jgi:hypothetical protein
MNLNESWQRFPEARIRMREQDLTTLVESLGDGGTFISGQPHVQLTDNGVLISFSTNAGTFGKLIALPIDVLIPYKPPQEPEQAEVNLPEVGESTSIEVAP